MTRFKNKLSNCQMTCTFNKKLGAFAIRLSELFHYKNDLAFLLNGKLCIITKPENTHLRGKYQCTNKQEVGHSYSDTSSSVNVL